MQVHIYVWIQSVCRHQNYMVNKECLECHPRKGFSNFGNSFRNPTVTLLHEHNLNEIMTAIIKTFRIIFIFILQKCLGIQLKYFIARNWTQSTGTHRGVSHWRLFQFCQAYTRTMQKKWESHWSCMVANERSGNQLCQPNAILLVG